LRKLFQTPRSQIDNGDRKQEKRRCAGADHRADRFELGKSPLQREGGACDDGNGDHDRQGMAEREEQSDCIGPLALLHQFAHHIVDGRDVVGVNRMTQTEHISEKGGAEQRWPAGERNQRPGPDQDGTRNQRNVERDNLRALVG
jgi:hypothetical protein